jgi:hypothetical protein
MGWQDGAGLTRSIGRVFHPAEDAARREDYARGIAKVDI